MNNSNLQPLITDRAAKDITARTDKGFYNLSDIERVNSYISYLSDELRLNLIVNTITFGEKLTREEMQGIIDNVNAIRAAWYVSTDTPQTPIPLAWDYRKANDLEKIVKVLDEFMQSVKVDKLYSGTFRAGAQIKFRGA